MYQGERLNGYTHLAGSVLAVAGAVTLIDLASRHADPTRLVSFSVYGATLCLLYLASTLYHSTRGRAKALLQKCDHCAIYLMIAGTYTPFALVTLNGTPDGWTLFAAVWTLAVVGILQELWIAKGMRVTSLTIYLVMGWLALIALTPLIERLSWNGFYMLLGGGLIYTVGVVFYLFDERFRHWHGIWHICVLAGSAVHYAAIVLFVA
jgi:hemolysin III